MELTNSSVREIIQEPGIDGMLRHIDYCAGVCYNRHGISKKGSEKFVKGLYDRGHMRPLEFGTVYLNLPLRFWKPFDDSDEISRIINSPYSRTEQGKNSWSVNVSTNFRVLCENLGFDEALEFIKMYGTEECFHERRTFGFILSRAIADEFRTHITLSSLMKSTRYVNEMKNGMKFVKPYWFVDGEEEDIGTREWLFCSHCEDTEIRYNRMVREFGMKPQEARQILALSLETELYQCGFTDLAGEGWDMFLRRRGDVVNADPDAYKLACELQKLIDKK